MADLGAAQAPCNPSDRGRRAQTSRAMPAAALQARADVMFSGQTGRPGLASRTPFVYGGAGHLLSRGTLRFLRRRHNGVEKCLDEAGKRCEQHSDWILAHCLLSTLQAVPRLTDWRDVMQQNRSACAAEAQLRPGEERRRCEVTPNVTCHGLRSPSQFRALGQKWC